MGGGELEVAADSNEVFEVSSHDTSLTRPTIVGLVLKPIGKPNAGNRHVRFVLRRFRDYPGDRRSRCAGDYRDNIFTIRYEEKCVSRRSRISSARRRCACGVPPHELIGTGGGGHHRGRREQSHTAAIRPRPLEATRRMRLCRRRSLN